MARSDRGGSGKPALQGSAYDQLIQGESGLLYYWPLGTVAGTEEFVANRTLTKVAGTGPTQKVGVLPNADNCQDLLGTNSLAGSSGYYTRAGEATMGIQAGMVLEAVVKRVVGTYGPVYPLNINYGTWNWWFEIDGANWTTVVWAPGGQKCLENQSVANPMALNTWYHLAMRVNSTNGVAFNTSSFYINAVLQSATQTNAGGSGTPAGNGLQIGSLPNGDTGWETYVAKVALYSSLADARILAHAQAMGLA